MDMKCSDRKVYNVSVPVIVLKVKEHKTIKDKLLELIKQQKSKSIFENNQSISVTDWNMDERKEYFEFLYPYIKTDLDITFFSMGELFINYEIIQVWFQQYYTGDNHSWHLHQNSWWSCVYYVELPDSSLGTTFKFPFDEKDYIFPVEEGDIILFPSYLMHCSPKNETDQRKTIISFNIKKT